MLTFTTFNLLKTKENEVNVRRESDNLSFQRCFNTDSMTTEGHDEPIPILNKYQIHMKIFVASVTVHYLPELSSNIIRHNINFNI
jgi:hypothetical protein